MEEELNAFDLKDDKLNKALAAIEQAAPMSQREKEYLEALDASIAIHDSEKNDDPLIEDESEYEARIKKEEELFFPTEVDHSKNQKAQEDLQVQLMEKQKTTEAMSR